jgi:hypothetical protein
MPEAIASFRITYERSGELRDDLDQMARGGLMVKTTDTGGLGLSSPVTLELVLPDGSAHATAATVIHVFPDVGVAVSVGPELVAQVRRRATVPDTGGGDAIHERVYDEAPRAAGRARGATATPTSVESATNAEKIQLALHGNRDQRNAILRDPNRTLHPYVLKNPQISVEDILAIAKNAQMSSELLKQISDRKDWFQRPQVALALARNPKTPADIAIRALDHCPADAVRLMAKGTGVLPLVAQAARKKVIK